MNELRMRRRAVLAAAPLVVAAPYVARAQGKPEKPKVVLAVGGKSALYYLSLTIAERKGFFKEAGLDVEINDFQGGSKSLQALMGGSADVVAGAYEHTIRMQQRGQPIVGFALIGRGMQISIGLRNDVAAKVKGPADIKGMKFGVTAPGSSTHMLLLNWAAKGGLKASDVVAIGVGAGATVLAAIEKGEVDGISQTDPALTMLGPRRGLAGRHAAKLQPGHHVGQPGAPRHQRVGLEHVAGTPVDAVGGDQPLAEHLDRAGRRRQKPGRDVQQGGLAAAGRADHRHELALGDAQRRVGDGRVGFAAVATGEAAGDVGQRQGRRVDRAQGGQECFLARAANSLVHVVSSFTVSGLICGSVAARNFRQFSIAPAGIMPSGEIVSRMPANDFS
jgi:ABC-type amino acid transport substrate-binding protein